MKRKALIWFLGLIPFCLHAQQSNEDISKGNEAYRKQEYSKAGSFYQRALQKTPGNPVAAFNYGNTLLKENKQEEAIEQFEASANSGNSKPAKADALYNKGVVYTRQKKLDESIDAYKSALRLNPADTIARQNLQRALNEKQKKQEQQKQDNSQQPKKQPKMNKQQVQQMLNALQEQEKQLQQRMQKSKVPAPGQPEKDWR
jgi:Ca-activated chloride channel family protein